MKSDCHDNHWYSTKRSGKLAEEKVWQISISEGKQNEIISLSGKTDYPRREIGSNSNFTVIKGVKAPVMGDGGPVSGVIKCAMTFSSKMQSQENNTTSPDIGKRRPDTIARLGQSEQPGQNILADVDLKTNPARKPKVIMIMPEDQRRKGWNNKFLLLNFGCYLTYILKNQSIFHYYYINIISAH